MASRRRGKNWGELIHQVMRCKEILAKLKVEFVDAPAKISLLDFSDYYANAELPQQQALHRVVLQEIGRKQDSRKVLPFLSFRLPLRIARQPLLAKNDRPRYREL